ncbi:MAG: hypothetical protein WCO94_08330 [Verrucomicrobiota bacterium]
MSTPTALVQKHWNYCNPADAGRDGDLSYGMAEVERLLSVVEELESVLAANLQRATRIRQSILQKTFTGSVHNINPL